MLVLDGGRTVASAQQKTSPELIERARLDWSHSGKLTTFSLFRQHDANGGATDRLVIGLSGVKSWSLTSHDGEWASMSEAGLSHLNKQNLVSTSKHFLFVSSGSADANIYLILKGVDSGCCVGSLTVMTPDEDGQPRIVFQASSHLLAALIPTEGGDALEMVGQSSDSEARALKNAQSYDPYRVYLLEHDRPARYDIALSKAYALAHYCQWHGPKYDEKFVAVGPTTGSAHCRVMTDLEFASYRQKHPQLFPEP
jgi:hypothetical protein